jgi:hypothetical protein
MGERYAVRGDARIASIREDGLQASRLDEELAGAPELTSRIRFGSGFVQCFGGYPEAGGSSPDAGPHVVIPNDPPGDKTRLTSTSAEGGSGTWNSMNADTTASKHAVASGGAIASATTRPDRAGARRTIPSARSRPTISAPGARSLSSDSIRPTPVPRSRTRRASSRRIPGSI